MKIYVVDEAGSHERYCTTLKEARRVAQVQADYSGMPATIMLCTVITGRAKDIAVRMLSGQGWQESDEMIATIKPRSK